MCVCRDVHTDIFFVSKLSEVEAFVPVLLDSQGSAPEQLQNQYPSLERCEDNSEQPSAISDCAGLRSLTSAGQ